MKKLEFIHLVKELLNDRELSKKEKLGLKKYEKDISKKDFIDRYGKEEGERIYYGTITKMAKKIYNETEDITAFVKTRGGKSYAIASSEKELQNLKKDPDITDIETDKGRQVKEVDNPYTKEDISLLGKEVGKVLAGSLETLGDEVLSSSIKVTDNKFSIDVVFKGNKKDTFNFYTQDNNLYYKGNEYDIELGEFIITPGEKIVINKSLINDKLTKYFRDNFMEEVKKAKKDYDKDGKIETPEEEYKGSRSKAIKKAMKKEESEIELIQDPKTKEFTKRMKLSDKDKELLKKIQALLAKEKQSKTEQKSDYQKRREAEADYKSAKKDVPPRPFKEPKNDYFARRKKEMGEDLDVGHQDDEPDMLKQYVYDIAVYAAKLYKQLNKYDKMAAEVDFPNWWQAKVIKAKDYISSAQHYLEFEEKQPALDTMALENDVNEEGMNVKPGPLKLAGHVKTTKGVYMDPDTGNFFVVVNGKGGYLGPFNSSGAAADAQVKYAGLSHSLREESQESGLYVTGRTPEDNTKIKQFLEDSDLYGEWNAREGYWFLPEEEDMYDSLERTLEQEFQARDINAKIEGIFNESKINEQKATCCGRCGRVHVKGTPCKKPYLSKSDPKHCQNKK